MPQQPDPLDVAAITIMGDELFVEGPICSEAEFETFTDRLFLLKEQIWPSEPDPDPKVKKGAAR